MGEAAPVCTSIRRCAQQPFPPQPFTCKAPAWEEWAVVPDDSLPTPGADGLTPVREIDADEPTLDERRAGFEALDEAADRMGCDVGYHFCDVGAPVGNAAEPDPLPSGTVEFDGIVYFCG